MSPTAAGPTMLPSPRHRHVPNGAFIGANLAVVFLQIAAGGIIDDTRPAPLRMVHYRSGLVLPIGIALFPNVEPHKRTEQRASTT